jgi:hypothetical protein
MVDGDCNSRRAGSVQQCDHPNIGLKQRSGCQQPWRIDSIIERWRFAFSGRRGFALIVRSQRATGICTGYRRTARTAGKRNCRR